MIIFILFIRYLGNLFGCERRIELICLFTVDLSGPDAIDKAINAGVDLDGTPIPSEMLTLYREVMDKENARKRSGVKKSMRNRIVKTGAKHYDQETLNSRLINAGWDGLKTKEIDFFYN